MASKSFKHPLFFVFLLTFFTHVTATALEKPVANDVLASGGPLVANSLSLTSPSIIFNSPNTIYEIFSVLESLEFQKVPEASLMAQNTSLSSDSSKSSSRVQQKTTESKKKSTTPPAKKNNSNTRTPANQKTVSAVTNDAGMKNEIAALKNKIKQLEAENAKLAEQSNNGTSALLTVAQNMVTQFSLDRKAQEEQRVNEVLGELENAQVALKKNEEQIAALNNLPKDGDEKLLQQITKKGDELNQLRRELETTQARFEGELEQKNRALEEAARTIATLKSAQERNSNVTENLANQLAQAQNPLKNEIERLTQENVVLKKAYQEEKQRATSELDSLSKTQQQMQAQLIATEQQAKNEVKASSHNSLQLQRRAQQAELAYQKVQQQLQLAEQKSINLQEQLDKLNAVSLKNSQSYQLQLTDLQQRLVNARRAEQEANRWARAAGVGNTNAANNRILNLQQQIDALTASEEQQRLLALRNQQQVIALQSHISSLQAEINAQIQTRKQLENQVSLSTVEEKPLSSDVVQNSVQVEAKTKDALNQQLEQSNEKQKNTNKTKLSTEAGMQKL